jgi:hypothetical protein
MIQKGWWRSIYTPTVGKMFITIDIWTTTVYVLMFEEEEKYTHSKRMNTKSQTRYKVV